MLFQQNKCHFSPISSVFLPLAIIVNLWLRSNGTAVKLYTRHGYAFLTMRLGLNRVAVAYPIARQKMELILNFGLATR